MCVTTTPDFAYLFKHIHHDDVRKAKLNALITTKRYFAGREKEGENCNTWNYRVSCSHTLQSRVIGRPPYTVALAPPECIFQKLQVWRPRASTTKIFLPNVSPFCYYFGGGLFCYRQHKVEAHGIEPLHWSTIILLYAQCWECSIWYFLTKLNIKLEIYYGMCFAPKIISQFSIFAVVYNK